MGALEVSHLSYRRPGGRMLFDDVSFRVGENQHVALVGANGCGKTTLMRIVVGEEQAEAGGFHVDGRLAYLPQFVGSVRDRTTVRDLLLALSPPELRAVAARLAAAEARADADGIAYAKALTAWGDAGGYDAEVLWDTCCTSAMRASLDDVGDRPVATLSGGEQKRLGLELLLQSDADVLLLDEPDNYLDIPGKRWLEDAIRSTRKTILLITHDREVLANTADKVVTIEGHGCWTHGAGFATWHEARQDRLDRIDEEHRRYREEHKRLETTMRVMKQRAAYSDALAPRAKALETKLRRFEATSAPPERPKDQKITVRLDGGRTGKRAVRVSSLGFPGLVKEFDTEVLFGERIGVIGPNGSGKTHFLRLLAGEPVDHTGEAVLGARVVPGYFNQTHDNAALRSGNVLDALLRAGLTRGPAMAALRRYELEGTPEQDVGTLSGGQQARLQVLLLELAGATLLLLDEPTDNLDLASAEALQDGLSRFEGTVITVTHDRWLMRSLDRFLVFNRDGTVVEHDDPTF